jgi:hypothetical protein
MKKTFRVLGMACLVGAFAFLGSSCNKETETTSSVQASLPVVEEAGTFGEGLRAYIDYHDGNKMKWSEGDAVMIYNLADNDNWEQSKREVYTLVAGAGTTQGGFMGQPLGERLSEGFRVFYPASKVVNHPLGERNSQTFDVPATQTYAYDCMDPTSLVMACKPLADVMEADHASFQMQHIFGFANIRIADLRAGGPKKVKSVKIEDCFYNLNGNITADLPGVDSGVLSGLIDACAGAATDDAFDTYMSNLVNYLHTVNYTSEPGDHTMTLNCPGGVQLKNDAYTNFIFSLRPGALSRGFDILITFTDGEEVPCTIFNPGADNCWLTNNGLTPNIMCTKPGNLINFNVILQ